MAVQRCCSLVVHSPGCKPVQLPRRSRTAAIRPTTSDVRSQFLRAPAFARDPLPRHELLATSRFSCRPESTKAIGLVSGPLLPDEPAPPRRAYARLVPMILEGHVPGRRLAAHKVPRSPVQRVRNRRSVSPAPVVLGRQSAFRVPGVPRKRIVQDKAMGVPVSVVRSDEWSLHEALGGMRHDGRSWQPSTIAVSPDARGRPPSRDESGAPIDYALRRHGGWLGEPSARSASVPLGLESAAWGKSSPQTAEPTKGGRPLSSSGGFWEGPRRIGTTWSRPASRASTRLGDAMAGGARPRGGRVWSSESEPAPSLWSSPSGTLSPLGGGARQRLTVQGSAIGLGRHIRAASRSSPSKSQR